MLDTNKARYMPTIGSFEGGIGAGKTTLVTSVGAVLEAVVFYEPTEKNPYLSDFYSIVNPPTFRGNISNIIKEGLLAHRDGITGERLAQDQIEDIIPRILSRLDEIGATQSGIPALMQLFLLTRRFDLYMASLSARRYGFKVALLDRSLHGDAVFARMLNAQGPDGRQFIDDRDMITYWGIWEMIKHLTPKIHFFVRLQVSPTELLRRIRERARGKEVSITLSYLQALEEEYNIFFDDIRCQFPVIELDYEEPRQVYDAHEFPESYPTLQSETDDRYRKVLHPDEAAILAETIMTQVPKFNWNDRMKTCPVEMAAEFTKTADFRIKR